MLPSDVTPLRRLALSFLLFGQLLHLFSLSDLVSTTHAVAALQVVGSILYFTVSLMIIVGLCIPELRENRVAALVTAVLAFLSGRLTLCAVSVINNARDDTLSQATY